MRSSLADRSSALPMLLIQRGCEKPREVSPKFAAEYHLRTGRIALGLGGRVLVSSPGGEDVRRIIVLLSVTALALMAVPVSASQLSDPRDSYENDFDVKTLDSSFVRTDGGPRYKISVTMWTRWSPRDLNCELEKCTIHIYLETKGTKRADYDLFVRNEGGDLHADVYQLGPRKLLTTLSVRNSGRTLGLALRKNVLKWGKKAPPWRVFTFDMPAMDDAPDAGWIPLR
jgi:hypothetical protein